MAEPPKGKHAADLPDVLAICAIQPPIEGDDALLRLAQRRLGEAGVGGELYPGSPSHLERLLRFRPRGLAAIAHLPRDIDILERGGREMVLAHARVAGNSLRGLLVHDSLALAENPERSVAACTELDRELARGNGPRLFVEYAAGLDPDQFAALFERTADLGYICPAIDVGHVGVHVCRAQFRRLQEGEDACSLQPYSPGLADSMDPLQAAVASALPSVLRLIARIAGIGKPVHFHLHDGHPLSTMSLFGVSDHLSFLQELRLPFAYHGTSTLGGMFGVSGLREIVATALKALPGDLLSFTLEIHPQEGRSALRDHVDLFAHWRDLANAERMNFWLDALLQNVLLVRDAMGLAKRHPTVSDP